MQTKLPVHAILNRYRRGEDYPTLALAYNVEKAVIRSVVHHIHCLMKQRDPRVLIRNHHLVRDYIHKRLGYKRLTAKYRLATATVRGVLSAAGLRPKTNPLRRDRALRLAFLSESAGIVVAAREVGTTTTVARRQLNLMNVSRPRPRRVNRGLLISIVQLRQRGLGWSAIDIKLSLGAGVARSYFYRYRSAFPDLLVSTG